MTKHPGSSKTGHSPPSKRQLSVIVNVDTQHHNGKINGAMGDINLDSTSPFCFTRHLSLSNAPKETNGRKEKGGFFSWGCCPLKTACICQQANWSAIQFTLSRLSLDVKLQKFGTTAVCSWHTAYISLLRVSLIKSRTCLF